MYIDSLLKVSAAQAFTAAQVSTNSVDLGVSGGKVPSGNPPFRELGTGEDVGFGVAVIVAASCTTVLVEVINTTDAALTAGLVVLGSITYLAADLFLGALKYVPIASGGPIAGWLEFLGVRVTPVGGAATVTLTIWLTAENLFSVLAKSYAKNFIA
jgi:hypothetical protein